MGARFSFGGFTLDTDERRLTRDGVPINLSGRYLDALELMACEPDTLITKERFHDEVWRGIPVTDEALTQCIRSLRKALGDDAANPRFIETVPKHGYRFVGEVEHADDNFAMAASPATASGWLEPARIAAAGTVGGGAAGLIGGIFYGLIGTSGPPAQNVGGGSTMLVLACLCALVGAIGGLFVSGGLAIAHIGRKQPHPAALILGGGLGGLIAGAVGRLVGLDAFQLLVGAMPGNITGAPEGVVLGLCTAAAAWLLVRMTPALPHALLLGGALGLAGGLLIALAGGNLMIGSLAELATQFPQSRLDIGRLGGLFDETGIGPISHSVLTTLEGALFVAGVIGALAFFGGDKKSKHP